MADVHGKGTRMRILYDGKVRQVDAEGRIDGDPDHMCHMVEGQLTVFFCSRPEGPATRLWSDRTYRVPYGAGSTAFFAEAEPDAEGYCRGSLAESMDEQDDDVHKVTLATPIRIHVRDLGEELDNVVWPAEVTR